MTKVTEFTSDGPRNQTQAASSQNLSLKTQGSPQTKVKAAVSVQVSNAISTGLRQPDLYPQVPRSIMNMRKQMKSAFP